MAPADRDVIVRWAETRRRIKADDGIDHDPGNLADPLLPAELLRAHVLAGERLAARRPDFIDPGGDLVTVVEGLRRGQRRAPRAPPTSPHAVEGPGGRGARGEAPGVAAPMSTPPPT